MNDSPLQAYWTWFHGRSGGKVSAGTPQEMLRSNKPPQWLWQLIYISHYTYLWMGWLTANLAKGKFSKGLTHHPLSLLVALFLWRDNRALHFHHGMANSYWWFNPTVPLSLIPRFILKKYNFLKQIMCFGQTAKMQIMESGISMQHLCGCQVVSTGVSLARLSHGWDKEMSTLQWGTNPTIFAGEARAAKSHYAPSDKAVLMVLQNWVNTLLI